MPLPSRLRLLPLVPRKGGEGTAATRNRFQFPGVEKGGMETSLISSSEEKMVSIFKQGKVAKL